MNAQVTQAEFVPDEAFDIGTWRYQNSRRSTFGLTQQPLPPLPASRAVQMLKDAYDASWDVFGIGKAAYRAEVAAIHCAVAEYQAAGRTGVSAKEALRGLLLDRDGPNCWICDEALGEDCTIEHKVPKSRGGTWAFANLALAHGPCNRLLGNAPLPVKEAVRAFGIVEARCKGELL